jgi:hypothetical protein
MSSICPDKNLTKRKFLIKFFQNRWIFGRKENPMDGLYKRLQRARLLSLSTPFDTTVLMAGNKAEIFSALKTKRVERLADELRRQGKVVIVHSIPYRLLQEDGWEGDTAWI